LTDIQSNYQTKEIISNIYYIRNKYLLEYEENADLYWLVSDLILFMKKRKLAIYTICNKIYNKSFNKDKIIPIHFLFNKFWSLLTPEQRDNFIQIRKIKY
jgi:hypothetical protein